jgi:thioredoxin-dependent peroxiredoxin
VADRPDSRNHLPFDCKSIISNFVKKSGAAEMNKIFLSAVIALVTLSFVQGAETQKQPEVGKPAPDFSLTTSDGSQVSLKDYRGKWVVLYFYPKDFTSGCTMEAHNFQRDLGKYRDADAVILGVSVDTAQSHKEFCAKEGLNFKLLADPDAKVSTEYGSVMDYKGSKLAARNTFIINPNGEIAKVYTGVKPADHSEQVLKDLAELKKS